MDITLFHYQFSPYAEKIRAMLGYSNLPWQSLEVSSYPPRPVVDTLAGGYSRIPVAQIGADIFCDSQIIVEEIANLANNPSLDIHNGNEDERALAKTAEYNVFFSVVNSGSQLTALKNMALNIGPINTFRFVKDRLNLAKKSNVRLSGSKNPEQTIQDHLDDLESRLSAQPFLAGDQPAGVDFCAYHPIWMLKSFLNPRPPVNHPNVMAWLDRMESLNQPGKSISDKDAIQQARACEPREVPESTDSAQLGEQVSIGPEDYRLETVSGELVASTDRRWIIKRSTSEAGNLHVHFPRQGYKLTP